jgi:hypothetical protein
MRRGITLTIHLHRGSLGARLIAIVAVAALVGTLALTAAPAFASHEAGDGTAVHHLPAGTATLDGTRDASYEKVAVLTHKGEPDGEIVADVYMVYDADAARLHVFIEMLSPYTIHETDHKIVLHNAAGRIFNSEGHTWNGIFGAGHASVEFSAAYACVAAPGEQVGLRLNYTRPDNAKTEARLPGQTDSPLLVMPIACPEEEVLPGEGDITVIKEADPEDTDAAFGFTFNGVAFGPLTHGEWRLFDELSAGTYTIAETSLPAGWVLDDVVCDADVWERTNDAVEVELGEGESVVCTFSNVFEEDLLPERVVEVSIMKHLCEDVTSVAEFQAIEALAGGNEFLALAFTVLSCPTIVADAGDVQTDSDVVGGVLPFDFTVANGGTQTLRADGTFMAAQLCEDDLGIDADGDPTTNVCLDVSHYVFGVPDGSVVVTEHQEPDGYRFGTLRFTPGSGDSAALATPIRAVEASGMIRLDTTNVAPDPDGVVRIMLHVYNFAEAEAVRPVVIPPEQAVLPGVGMPDTATGGPGWLPILLALGLMGSVGVVATANVAARRRR